MKVTFIFLVICLGLVAHAQLYPTKLGMLRTCAMRFGEKRVHFELGLDDGQVVSIREILESHGRDQAVLSQRLSKAKPTEFASIQASVEALEIKSASRVLALLNSVQRNRLWQIAIQENGPFAMRDAEVAKKIGLTPEQKIKLESIASRVRLASDEVNAQMGIQMESAKSAKSQTAIFKSFEPKLAKLEQNGENEVLLMLSKTQIDKWKRAKGRPFKL